MGLISADNCKSTFFNALVSCHGEALGPVGASDALDVSGEAGAIPDVGQLDDVGLVEDDPDIGKVNAVRAVNL